MIKLLWIDDNLYHDLAEKRMSLMMEDDIESDFAGDATEAYYRLIDPESPYDIIIFDLRFPAGSDDMWDKYREDGEQKYGPILLKMVKENKNQKFDHLKAARYAVFTIETDNENLDLFEPPISLDRNKNFKMKIQLDTGNEFINFIREIYAS